MWAHSELLQVGQVVCRCRCLQVGTTGRAKVVASNLDIILLRLGYVRRHVHAVLDAIPDMGQRRFVSMHQQHSTGKRVEPGVWEADGRMRCGGIGESGRRIVSAVGQIIGVQPGVVGCFNEFVSHGVKLRHCLL